VLAYECAYCAISGETVSGIILKASGAKTGPAISIPPTIMLHDNQKIYFINACNIEFIIV
jgi:hypothetical protein